MNRCLRRLVWIGLVSSLAAATHGQAAQTHASGETPEPDSIGDVELPPIFAPIAVNGRLVGYAYMTIGLTPASRDKVLDIRTKVPFLQDAFLREVNRAGIMSPDMQTVDKGAKDRLMARINGILPPDTVSDLKFIQVVSTRLRPE